MRAIYVPSHGDFSCVAYGLAVVVAIAATGGAEAARAVPPSASVGAGARVTAAFAVAERSFLKIECISPSQQKAQEVLLASQLATRAASTTTGAVRTEFGAIISTREASDSERETAISSPRRRSCRPFGHGAGRFFVKEGGLTSAWGFRRYGEGIDWEPNGKGLRMGWHPAAEPELPEDDETFHDNWRRVREEELWKDQFLTPGRVNEIMDPSNIQRLKFNVNPDSSFGAIFQLDTLVDVIPGLIYPAWREVARALNQREPTLKMVQRGYGWTPEQMFLREFNWRLTQEEVEGGIEVYDRAILRTALKYEPTEIPGSRQFLGILQTIPMPTVVLSRLPGSVVGNVLSKTGLGGFFNHRVTGDDEKYDDYRGYMLAAIKIQRSTMKCCAFDCRQVGMMKAHDAEMRGICQIGVMAAWELKLADYSVESFNDVTILDFRQIFADREFEEAPKLELQPEAAPKQKTSVATKVSTRAYWPDEEDEPEPETDRGGGGGGRGRRRPGRRW